MRRLRTLPSARRQARLRSWTPCAAWLVGWVGSAALSVSAAEVYPSTLTHRAPGGFDPLPYITLIQPTNQQVLVQWDGFEGPYVLMLSTNLSVSAWTPAGPATSAKSQILPAGGGLGIVRVKAPSPAFAGAGVCRSCHGDLHTNWAASPHASALETLKRIGQDKNPQCLPCHTVGYGVPTGYVDEVKTPYFAGVQCENCHGPSLQHAQNQDELSLRPRVEMSAMMCGGCHTTFHHGIYESWTISAHSRALQQVQTSVDAGQDCLKCHSQDYRYALERGLAPPTVAEANLAVECSTCHDPHGNTGNPAQLAQPVQKVCGECHSLGDSLLGGKPHYPQFDMLRGVGAYETNGAPMVKPGTHTKLTVPNGASCAQCHVVKLAVANPSEASTNSTLHTFDPFALPITSDEPEQYQGCDASGCHDTPGMAFFLSTVVQPQIQERLQALAPYFDPADPFYIDPNTLGPADRERLRIAHYNYDFVVADKSLGVHNATNTREALRVAETIVQDLQPQP